MSVICVYYSCQLSLGVQVIVHVADEEFFKAEFAVVAAQAGLADARMEALEGLEVLAVYIGLAVVQLVQGAHDGIPVGGIDGRGQTEDAVVGFFDHLVKGLEGRDRQDGSENLLGHDPGAVLAAGDDSGLIEVALAVYGCGMSAAAYGRAVRNGTLDQLVHMLLLCLVDHGLP